MTTLVAFESAARCGSFKIAANELNVTPGAVSHQIKALEVELGAALFERVHRGVSLTEEGRDLFSVVQTSFLAMSRGVGRIRRPDEHRAITIGATTAVSSLWLTSRITRFWRAYPDIRINQLVSDSRLGRVRNTDIFIQYGRDSIDNSQSKELFRDTLVPIAAPKVAAELCNASIEQLAATSLIHMRAEDQNWTTWNSWFSALGHTGTLARGSTVNNYMIALQSAQDGVGVVLGWRRLVAPFLSNGSLNIVEGFEQQAPSGFHIVRGRADLSDPHIDVLESWLLEHAL
jgi:DNA-binding transcriptional LysR family regulator